VTGDAEARQLFRDELARLHLDWDDLAADRRFTDYDVLVEIARRLRHIRTACWIMAGFMIASVVLGLIAMLITALAPKPRLW
jgi:hypothetical protein